MEGFSLKICRYIYIFCGVLQSGSLELNPFHIVQVGQVATGAMAKGQQVMDAGLSTPLGRFWLQQLDATLDATEKLLVHYYLPPVDHAAESEIDFSTLCVCVLVCVCVCVCVCPLDL